MGITIPICARVLVLRRPSGRVWVDDINILGAWLLSTTMGLSFLRFWVVGRELRKAHAVRRTSHRVDDLSC